MDYSGYRLEDFVADEYFIRWVKSPTEESNGFWNAWLSKHPEQRLLVKEAREMILLLDIEEHKAPEGRFLEIWENIIREDTGEPELLHGNESRSAGRVGTKWYYKLAASLLFFILVGAGLFIYSNRTVNISTAYGESRTLFLPDSTKVTLNSNSTICFSSSSFDSQTREVWLDGEAFFAVVRKGDHQGFLVHTDELRVEVLGTRFNVNTRRGKTTVVLEEGKVKLALNSNNAPLIMKPGDLVEFSKADKVPVRRIVDPASYLSWKSSRLIFTSTSLRDIAHLLEDNYGYLVKFEDEEMLSRKFTGSASSDNIQELLQKLSIVFDLDIQQENKKLTIRYRKETPKQLPQP